MPEDVLPPARPDNVPLPARTKYGTKRLKKIVARFRSNLSQEEDPVEETCQSAETPASVEHPTPDNGDPASNSFAQEEIPPAQDSPGKSVHFDDNPKVVGDGDGERKVSAQTMESQESQESSQTEDTVCRHPTDPELIPTPTRISLEEWSWPGLMYYPEDGTHIRGGSDPFSDGKGTESQLGQPSSSKRPDRCRDHSKTSEASLDPIPEDVVDKIESASLPERTSSMISNLSWMREPCQLEPTRATVALNQLITRFGIHVPTVLPEPENGPRMSFNFRCELRLTHLPVELPQPEEQGSGRRGFRLMSRVRKVRSGLAADTSPQVPKLRRTKTFATLRRPVPMTSLRGRSVETLARLGGHAFLMLADLAPFPLQLPACIVATVMFLHRYGSYSDLLRHDLANGFLQVQTCRKYLSIRVM
jgi:hypothetical protein